VSHALHQLLGGRTGGSGEGGGGVAQVVEAQPIKAGLRAAACGGRPRAGSDTTVTGHVTLTGGCSGA
jgi:hypothetical protein